LKSGNYTIAPDTIETIKLAIRVEMIQLLIVEDQPAVRKGLQMRLAAESDIRVIGEALDGDSARDLATTLCPDVVLVDIDMPGMEGIATASELHSIYPQASLIILSIQDDTLTCKRAANVGAAAFVAKSLPAEILLKTIRQVYERRTISS
jgi:DNA-binding NarL/FixJ family response regulator